MVSTQSLLAVVIFNVILEVILCSRWEHRLWTDSESKTTMDTKGVISGKLLLNLSFHICKIDIIIAKKLQPCAMHSKY